MENRIESFFKKNNITKIADILSYCNDLRELVIDNATKQEMELLFSTCEAPEDVSWLIITIFKDYLADGVGLPRSVYYEAELKNFLSNNYFDGSRIITITDLYTNDGFYVGDPSELNYDLLFDIVDTYRDEWLSKEMVCSKCSFCKGKDENCEACSAIEAMFVALGVVAAIVLFFKNSNILSNKPVADDLLKLFQKDYPEELAYIYLSVCEFPDFCAFVEEQNPAIQKKVMQGFETSEGEQAYLYRYHPDLFDLHIAEQDYIDTDLMLHMLQNGDLPVDYLAKFWFDTDYIDEVANELGVQVLIDDFIEFLKKGIYDYDVYYNVENEAHDLINYAINIGEGIDPRQQEKIYRLVDDWIAYEKTIEKFTELSLEE